ncbi:hypothetical protein DB30_02792 [Enhygromyxa salina]|uniref:Uncharacterized protein n=1 Tax=Enhygromyxa salina TaxID=215803 RepID=A0A0C1ZJW8_9BACT|nr:hypothetical protein [Enhygromyxa salina]KIG17759.1 hypothetical protein DB30_02792 [Enhygromyxa salina]
MIAPPEVITREPGLGEQLWFYLTSRTETSDMQFGFAVLAIAVLLAGVAWRTLQLHRRQSTDPATPSKWLRWGDRMISAALLVAALGSATQYFYGSRNNDSWLHRWDLYHQVIGAKYFSEVGYFRIYECTWEIDATHERHFRRVAKMRDIETLKILPTAEAVGEMDCAELFTDEARLEQFAKDVNDIHELGGHGMWNKLFSDKGFNGTPFHAWILSKLTAHVDIVEKELIWLGLLDVFLMMFAFGCVAWAWDVKTAAIAMLFFCANFPNRYIHMGGSILRFDYIAMLIIALALMKKDRFAIAGACVAWATAERVFPAVFAAGLGFKAGVELLATRKLRREYLHFGLGFVLGLLVLVGLSLSMSDTIGGGVDNWRDWWANMKVHTEHTRGFRVGFKHMFMMDGNVTERHRFMGWASKTKAFHTRDHYYLLTMAALFGPLVLAVRKLDAVTFAALFCAAGFFTLTIATRYYYSVMVLFILVDRNLFEDRKQMLLTALLCLTAAFLTKTAAATSSVPYHYNTASSAAFAGYFVILGALLWIDPWLRDRFITGTDAADEPATTEPTPPET